MALFKSNRSGFPKIPFFIVRLLQFLCGVVVLGVLGFFQYHLWADDYRTPYEFSLLDFAASATLLNIIVTTIFVCCCGLSPLYIIIVDSILTILWAACFGLLLKAMGKTTIETATSTTGATALASVSRWWLLQLFMRKRETNYKYTPTPNPANLQKTNTSYNPPHNSAGAYGVPPPPAYNTPEQYGAGAPPTARTHQNPAYYS
ncbi:hypothetical protein BDD12DRAFT_876341 [Trichophaea hybrida]|nr:hypothetical protein BDD12DRAFT_897718 [Trichophaea hybrida]KAF8542549.1 hypothetical protein BDD12DRAFT_876341 [Trichophaea hybrida]